MAYGKSKIVKRKKSLFINSLYKHKFEIVGVLMFAALLFIGASLISFNSKDNSWFYYSSDNQTITNYGGMIGANISALFFYLFGSGAYIVLALMLFISLSFLSKRFKHNTDGISGILLTLTMITLLKFHGIDFTSSHPGGLIGLFFYNTLTLLFGFGGSLILLYSMAWICTVLILRLSIFDSLISTGNFALAGFSGLVSTCKFMFGLMFKKARRYSFLAVSRFSKNDDVYIPKSPIIVENEKQEEPEATPIKFESNHLDKEVDIEGRKLFGKNVPTIRNSIFSKNIFSLADEVLNSDSYNLPDVSVFKSNRVNLSVSDEVEQQCKRRAEKLEEKLEHFGVEGRVSAILPGPVVTLFEYTPEIGTKISKIMALEDDLAMVLKALSIRIIAPIPGRSVVGFEISNETREDVYLSDILLNDTFQKSKLVLPLVLGVDIIGKPIIEDLLKMPHLLVAGSTGSGKSVGMNAMLVSLLCRLRPDEMRLVLIDPKRLEFSAYRDIPHLLFPIVTDPRRVPTVLKWVVQEMERRYEKMAEVGVRNLNDYRKLDSVENMPFIVVMIDELADLMMVAGKDVEMYIARIAQMARAAGIHMIIATQRPSVDVLTGVIKVNFPSRISFRVSSKVDSKTIIDSSGAEKLLGKGDMLCSSPRASDLLRVHGAYVSDEEISKLTNHLKLQQETDYLDLDEMVSSDKEDDIKDDLYPEVVEFVKTLDEVSISMLQRKYRIGFNRSARLIEKLELSGIIAPAQGSKPRKVL